VLKCAAKQTWRPERVVWVAGGGGSVTGGAVAGVALAEGLKVVFPQSASFIVYTGLTLSACRSKELQGPL
jgi:hypothetical protein